MENRSAIRTFRSASASCACAALALAGCLFLHSCDFLASIFSPVSAPVFAPDPTSTYSGSVEVTITSATSGAEIRYETGSSPAAPTASSALYTAPLRLTATTTIKAVAVFNAVLSAVSTATYTFGPPPVMAVKKGTAGVPSGGSIDLGHAQTGGEGSDVSFTILNTGESSLRLTGTPRIAVGGTDASEFSVVAQPRNMVIAGGSVSFTVRFLPASQGAKTATVAISNNTATDPYAFTVTGTADPGYRYTLRFGSDVTSPGRLNRPGSIAFNSSTGILYVLDVPNARVNRFTWDGNGFAYLDRWGDIGTADGSFRYPQGIGLDGSGNVYVADTGNNRIQKFDAVGTFLDSFGSGGDGPGQFGSPWDVAVSPSGTIYVSDRDNHRIQVFSSAFVLQATWGTYGSGAGQLKSPMGIWLDTANNRLLVADSGNWRIVVFHLDGSFSNQFGSQGSGDGEFYNIFAVAVDASSRIHGLDGYSRIEVFDSSGNYLSQFGAGGRLDGQIEAATDIRFDTAGNILVADSGNFRLQAFDAGGVFLAKYGSDVTGDGRFRFPQGVAVGPDGSVFVADQTNWRIQHFDSSGSFLAAWNTYNNWDPYSVAVASDGTVVVASQNTIERYTSSGGFLGTTGSSGSGNGEFSGIGGICVDAAGTIYVADSGNHRCQKLASDGTFLLAWGTYGSGDGQFKQPQDIAVDPSGNIYVADGENLRIQKFDSNRVFLSQWGSNGSGNGQFGWPIGIATDSSGNVYVADKGRFDVQKFTSAGVFLAKWGSRGTGDGKFTNPLDVAVDAAGNAYVVDGELQRVQKFVMY